MRAIFLLMLLSLTARSMAAPVPPIYTYQGELKENGVAKNGTADFTFRVFDSAQGGAEMQVLTVENIAVNNGLFTALLALDPSLFHAGGVWWLAIEVRDGAFSNAEPFETLAPRQPVTTVPYATNSQAVGGRRLSELLSAYKRTDFAFKYLSEQGEPSAALVSLTAEAPGAGQLVFRARGMCALGPKNTDTEVRAAIAIGLDESDSDSDTVLHGTILSLDPRGTPSEVSRLEVPFTAERAYPVLDNEVRTATLFGNVFVGGAQTICSGSLTAEFFPGTL